MSLTMIRKIILMILVCLLGSGLLFADAPYEEYHVAYKDISKDVLKNTIGILTINSGVKEGTNLKTYLISGNKFTFNKILKVKETIPVSNFGYHSGIEELDIDNYRYPVVSQSDNYLCIVYDPKKNSQAWIDTEEAKQDFYFDLVMIDSMPTPFELFVDVFNFTEDGKREIYTEPKKDAPGITISKELFEQSLLKVTDQKNGFIKIEGPAFVSHDIGKGHIELSGWIRIRDDEGNLIIWIKNVDVE